MLTRWLMLILCNDREVSKDWKIYKTLWVCKPSVCFCENRIYNVIDFVFCFWRIDNFGEILLQTKNIKMKPYICVSRGDDWTSLSTLVPLVCIKHAHVCLFKNRIPYELIFLLEIIGVYINLILWMDAEKERQKKKKRKNEMSIVH